MKDIKFLACDYKKSIELTYDSGMVIYCDPPYQGTKRYANALAFDYNGFWQVIFECLWEQEVSRSIKAADKSKSTEKLFKYKGSV